MKVTVTIDDCQIKFEGWLFPVSRIQAILRSVRNAFVIQQIPEGAWTSITTLLPQEDENSIGFKKE